MKNEDIKKAFESITPDNEAKERMLKAIIEKSQAASENASVKPENTPWYVKFKAQIGVCSAAAVCAAVFALTVISPGIKDIGDVNNFVVPKQSEEIAATQAAVTGITTDTDKKDAAFTVAYTTSVSKNHQQGENISKNTSTATEVLCVTDAQHSDIVTKAVNTTTAASSLLTTKTTAQSTETHIETSSVSAETTTETTVSSYVSLYGNLFDFSHVTWAGRSYATDYAETSYSKIKNILGSGVAMDDEGNTYTILLYSIDGVTVEDGLAVQYIGNTNYYVFYCIE